MARGDGVIANSHFTAELIRDRHGVNLEKIDVIHRGIDMAAFGGRRIAKGRLDRLRKAWKVGEGQRIILHAARLTGWKGQEVTIQAMRLLRNAGLTDAVCVLAGDDQGRARYRERLENLITAYGLGEQVRLAGHCEDMPAAFALASLAVVPSTEAEAFGRSAAEAQAAGCPVIASRLGAVAETVLAPPAVAPEKRTGWHVPPNDADALAAAMREALSLAPHRLRAVGTRGKAHISASFSLGQMQEKTLEVYDRLLGTDLAKRFAAR